MAKAKRVAKPKLHLCAADWSMRGYPSPKKEWSTDTKVRKAAEAGFAGFSAGPNQATKKACEKYGMVYIGGIDVGRARDAEPKLRMFKEVGAYHINVQLCDHDTEVKDSVKVARAVIQAGEKLGLLPAIEVHRDTCTETPEKAFALASAYEKRYRKKLRMNFDHSHPAIIKQLRPDNFWPRLAQRLDLLRMAEMMHLRTFTGSHCQTPVTNGRGKLDRDFIAWRDHFCAPMLEAWLQGAKSGSELYAVIELGPQGSGYALECFPDIWKDAIVARGEIEAVWKKLVRRWKPRR